MNKIKFDQCSCEIEPGKFDIKNIPLDCPAVWNLISLGYTTGIFQLESRLGMDWAKKVKPQNIKELAALTAILRPSCLECIGGNTKILRRKLYNDYIRFTKNIKYGSNKKLSKEQLLQIQNLLDEKKLKQRQIAKQFNVSEHIVSRIKSGKSYRGCKKYLNIISIDEKRYELFNNKIIRVIKLGKQKTYKLKIKNSYRISDYKKSNFNISATEGHLFLTKNGWKKLKDIKCGEYIASVNKWCGKYRAENKYSNGWKNFKNIAFYNYKYRCVFCDWDQISLDVHHIYNTRYTNNNAENLVWLCPNHHRMCTENKIIPQDIKKQREQYRLTFKKDIKFVQVLEIIEDKEEETYDIQVEGPNHNYIAGDFIVHNSGMSESYADVKNGRKKASYLHPAMEDIFKDTHGAMIFQEEILRVATELAGFSLEDGDQLRIAMSKKKADLMAKLKVKFIDGCIKKKNITKEVAEEIFGWIEKSQRYSFNYSHAISYAMLSYQTCYIKCHFPLEFFTSYLTYSNYKADTMDEIYRLVQDARLFGIEVLQPDIRECNTKFKIVDDKIRFGLSNIKGVGESAINKIIKNGPESMSTWQQFLKSVPSLHKNIGIALIKSGACDCYGMQRSQMVKELESVFGTTIKDKDGKTKDIKGLTERERKWFFYKLDDSKTIKDVFEEMTNKVNELSTKSLSGMKKESIIEFTKEFTGLTDEDLCGKTKFDIINILKKYGYETDKENKPCSNIKRINLIKEKIQELNGELIDTNLGRSTAEKYFLGISLSSSPADDADNTDASHTCLELAKAVNGQSFSTCCVIDTVKHTKTKKGKNPGAMMCFLTISDSTYSIDHAVIFPDSYEKIGKLCKETLICMVYGEKKNGSIIIHDIKKLI